MRAWVAGLVLLGACAPEVEGDRPDEAAAAAPIRYRAERADDGAVELPGFARDVPRRVACWPRSCAQLGANCGTMDDGCGGRLECGGCSSAMTCGPSNACTNANARFRQLSTGGIHTCGLMSDGTLWCWGWNPHGQLGDGTTINRVTPIQVGRDSDWKSVSAGQHHTCALKQNGTLWCWGANWAGELGDGSEEPSATPVQVKAYGDDWTTVAAGDATTCALRTAGTLWCWGLLLPVPGLDDWPTVSVPALISSSGHWRALDNRGHTLCAISDAGAMECWSQYADYDEDAQRHWRFAHESAIPGSWASVNVIATGNRCAVRTDGTLWCGAQPARQGVDTDWARHAGSQHAWCALRRDQSLWCGQGSGAAARLGNERWLDVSGRNGGFCGIRDDGSTWCWNETASRFTAPTQIHP